MLSHSAARDNPDIISSCVDISRLGPPWYCHEKTSERHSSHDTAAEGQGMWSRAAGQDSILMFRGAEQAAVKICGRDTEEGEPGKKGHVRRGVCTAVSDTA
jgi:hypothetical protein